MLYSYSIINSYIAYLKDNPKGYWFKRKLYGWGWTPARWQGWVVLIGFVAAIMGNARRLNVDSNSGSVVPVDFLLQTFLLVVILIMICYKTGEPPKWQWGIPCNKKHND